MSGRLKLEIGLLVMLSAVVLWGGFRRRPAPRRHPVLSWAGYDREIRRAPRSGGLDATFFHVSDLHAGSEACELHTGIRSLDRCVPISVWHRRLIDRLVTFPGTPFPEEAGALTVQPPAAMIVTGDLTQEGRPAQWREYLELFGPAGGLPFAVWDIPGNHDLRTPVFTRLQCLVRQGGWRYFRDVGDLRLIALGEAPDQDDLLWLREVLTQTGRERPVILYLHLPFEGPFSDNWFTRDTFTQSLGDLLDGFRIIAILHGHFHDSGYYRWRGFDVYNIGSVKHQHRDVGVIRITDTHFTYAAWNLELQTWWWVHHKPIHGHPGPETLKVLHQGPWVPYPQAPPDDAP